MSYCRFSSNNWMCDVYVYDDVSGGWTTHVAARKRAIPPIPDLPYGLLPSFGGKWDRETRRVVYPSPWRAVAGRVVGRIAQGWYRLHMWSLHLIPLRPIGLAHDGARFNDASAADCADRLEMLRRVGYTVPQYAIDALRAEMADPDQE